MHPKSSQISVDGFLFLDQTIWRMQKKREKQHQIKESWYRDIWRFKNWGESYKFRCFLKSKQSKKT